MVKRRVTWTRRAARQLNATIEYIRKISDQNADAVKEKILHKISELEDDKVVHRIDPYKKNSDGHYLCFEILKCRIVYYAEKKEVFIIRIRHTKMEPEKY